MIKFFSKIKRDLLSEGKTRKYLQYAFGEIVLVVIGILIALQVNNCKEQNNLEKEYIADLETIKENLKLDSVNLSANNKTGAEVVNYWKGYLKNDTLLTSKPFLDYLSSPIIILEENGYQNLRKKGTQDFIVAEDFKNSLNNYYIRNKGFLNSYNEIIKSSSRKLKDHYLRSGVENKEKTKTEILNQLRQEAPFADYLNKFVHDCEIMNATLDNQLELNKELSKIIDLEIKK